MPSKSINDLDILRLEMNMQKKKKNWSESLDLASILRPEVEILKKNVAWKVRISKSRLQ